jgi:hypothetical protein
LKLLLDEMLSPAIARVLRARGHDVVALKEQVEWEGASDAELMALARQERRVIVTANVRDFRALHAELVTPGGAGHAGLVLVSRAWPLAGNWGRGTAAALEQVLAEHPGADDLVGAEHWL